MTAIPAPVTAPAARSAAPARPDVPAVPVDDLHVPAAMERVRVYVWQIPVRFTHWLTFASIVVLSFSGAYIADPYLFPFNDRTMSTFRFIHLLAAFAFLASGVIRTYWLFAGNQFAKWSAFVPTNRRHLREFASQTAFYAFLRNDLPGILGHNALAGGTYFVVFFLFLIQTVTGLGLQGLHGEQPFAALFGWVPALLGEQGTRFIHHLLMWVIAAFAVHHVYSALLVDHIERSGLMSSIFSGNKFVPRWRIEEARDGGIRFEQFARRKDIEESLEEVLDDGHPLDDFVPSTLGSRIGGGS